MTTKEFWVSFDDAKFETGYISFEKKIEEINESQVFKIFNEYVLPEFESIKNWFVRKLRTKRFRVIAKINFGFNDPPEIEATSVQIAQISPELIDSIKYDRTDQLTKELGDVNSEKSSFTADEMFTFLSDESEGGNIFNQSEEDILNYFIGIKNVRNKKQLAYLSDKKQSVNYRLRYTLRPTFGFLFFVEGSTKEHFVWEMLDSNATYVWSINKGQYEAHFDIIDKILSRIKSKGRNGYKQEYQKEKRRDDFIFDIIRHDHIATQETDGYLIWKNKIDNLLN